LSDKDLKKLGFTEEIIRVGRYVMFTQRFSLDKPVNNESDIDFHDLIETQTVDFDESPTASEHRQALSNIIKQLDIDERERLILALRNGIVAPGLDYKQKVKVPNLDEPTTLGEIVVMVREYNFEVTLEDVGAIVGLTRERVRQIQWKANHKILKGMALNNIYSRLMLDKDEINDFETYFLYKDSRPGRVSAEAEAKSQRQAEHALELLNLLDIDLEEAFERTMEVMVEELEATKLAQGRMEGWLKARFGLIPRVGRLPLYRKDPSGWFDINETQTLQSESVMFAVIADIWGKLPKKLQIAS
jgi:hypothetical protein